MQAVRAQAEWKDIPLGLMGESQGGWVVPLAATQLAAAGEPVDDSIRGHTDQFIYRFRKPAH